MPTHTNTPGRKSNPWYEEWYFGLKSFTDFLAALFIALNNFVYYACALVSASPWISIPFLIFITAISLTIQLLESISFYRKTHQEEAPDETHKPKPSNPNSSRLSRYLAWLERNLEDFLTWCSKTKTMFFNEIETWNLYKKWDNCSKKRWYKITSFALNIVIAFVVSYTIFVSKSKSMHTLFVSVASSWLSLPTIIGLTFFASCVYSAKNLLRTLHAIGDEGKKTKPKPQETINQANQTTNQKHKPKSTLWVRGWCAVSLLLSPFIKNIVDGYTAYLLIKLVMPSYIQTTLALAISIGAAGLLSDLHNNWILYWQHFYHHKMTQGVRIWNNILTLFDRIGNTARLFFALEHTNKPLAAKNFLLATSVARSYLEVLRRDYVNSKHSVESPKKKQQLHPSAATAGPA